MLDLESIEDLIPDRGHIILTSRHYKLPGAINVDIMTKAESVELLKKIISPNRDKEEKKELYQKLAYKLGHLPLALAQAAAYISENVISVTDYLELYKTEKDKLLRKKCYLWVTSIILFMCL